LEGSESLPFRPFPPDARPVETGEKTRPKKFEPDRLIGPTQRTRDDGRSRRRQGMRRPFKAPAPSHWLGARRVVKDRINDRLKGRQRSRR
jgi:hypothetical protein